MPEIETDQQILINWLSDRDAACPLCQYNLRGLTSPKCPECGQLLQLSVSLAEPYLKAWIALLVGLLLPAGFGVMLIIGFSMALLHEGMRIFTGIGSMPAGPAFMMAHALACVPLSAMSLGFRRRFLSWPRANQQGCAALAWILVLITALILLSDMRF